MFGKRNIGHLIVENWKGQIKGSFRDIKASHVTLKGENKHFPLRLSDFQNSYVVKVWDSAVLSVNTKKESELFLDFFDEDSSKTVCFDIFDMGRFKDVIEINIPNKTLI